MTRRTPSRPRRSGVALDSSMLRPGPDALPASADETAQVDRLWRRIDDELSAKQERTAELASAPAARRGRFADKSGQPGRWVLALAAASLAAFAGGVVAGRTAPPSVEGDVSAIAATDAVDVDVFAAGERRRRFALPGGGTLDLEPHSMVEIAHSDDSILRLRLVRGGASVDTLTSGRSGRIAIEAGEARLASAGSIVSLRRRDRNVDVRVDGGEVQLTSPDGAVRLRTGDHARNVPAFRTLTSRSDALPEDEELAFAKPLTAGPDDEVEDAELAEAVEQPPEPEADWFALYGDNQWKEARTLLESKDAARAVQTATTAEQLYALADIFAYDTLGIMANKRLVHEFGDTARGKVAAEVLYRHFLRQGLEDEANKYEAFLNRDVLGADENACVRLQASLNRTPLPASVHTSARSYLGAFPDGQCRDVAQALVDRYVIEQAEIAAQQQAAAAQAAEEPMGPPTPPPVEDGTYDSFEE